MHTFIDIISKYTIGTIGTISTISTIDALNFLFEIIQYFLSGQKCIDAFIKKKLLNITSFRLISVLDLV